MTDWAGTAVVVSGLLVAVWCLVSVVRARAVDRNQLIGLVLVQLLVFVHIGYGIGDLARGGHPNEYATFIGYLIAFGLVIPVAIALVRAEPTKWGALIAAVACVVDAILVLRLHQVWTGVG
jgi:hypothetical protein